MIYKSSITDCSVCQAGGLKVKKTTQVMKICYLKAKFIAKLRFAHRNPSIPPKNNCDIYNFYNIFLIDKGFDRSVTASKRNQSIKQQVLLVP